MADDDITEDGLLGGRVRVLQPRDGYRAAIDPVFLAAAAAAGPGGRVADIGCGTGAAALCLAARRPDLTVVGIERDSLYAELARRGAALSGLADRVSVAEGDVRDPASLAFLGGFDAAIANPPFFRAGTRAPDARRAAAHHDAADGLDAWVACAAALLKPRGGFVMIHLAERLDDLLAAFAGRFGAAEVIPLWPKPGREAKRVLVRAVKGRRTPLRLSPGIVLHRDDGKFTAAAERILRGAADIDAAIGASAEEENGEWA